MKKFMKKFSHRKLVVTSAQCDTRPEMLESLDERRIVRSKTVEFILVFLSIRKTSLISFCFL